MPGPAVALGADVTLFEALAIAARTYGLDRPILEDAERHPLTYRRLILGSLVLGDQLAALTRRREAVGVLLPNVAGLAVTVFGLNAFGRVSALLNFTSGVRNLRSAITTAVCRTIVTSRKFVELGKLHDVVAGLNDVEIAPGVRSRVVYLEDVRKKIGLADKLKGLARAQLPRLVHRAHALKPDQTAVILFTSGTEGVPKGVALTSRNLVANSSQIFMHANGHFTSADTLLNPLPMFHSFGLTAGTLMPLLNGMRTLLYPTPLHYKQIPKLIADAKATVLMGTDTFIQGYARAAEPGELNTLRYVVAGAERVKEATRRLWEPIGTVLLEGYGATECSPVLAVNLPETNTPGTVGTLLPGIEARLKPVEGIEGAGALEVRGPNVMAGYLKADVPGVVQPVREGWYDTGDIVAIAPSGHLSIKGRARRFAKIGGEMVSLAAVETLAQGLWPEHSHVCLNVPDPRKGESLILVTDQPDATSQALLGRARSEGFNELWVPKNLIILPEIPRLGSGKVDVPSTQDLIRARTAAAA